MLFISFPQLGAHVEIEVGTDANGMVGVERGMLALKCDQKRRISKWRMRILLSFAAHLHDFHNVAISVTNGVFGCSIRLTVRQQPYCHNTPSKQGSSPF
jgi:hypothetical protein